MLGERGIDGVGVDGLRDGDALLGCPAVRVFSVERFACYGSLDSCDGVERRDGPVGTEGERCACIEQRFPRVAGVNALWPKNFFGPAAVVDRMIRLHRSDHAELGEARIVGRMKMLDVFDTR